MRVFFIILFVGSISHINAQIPVFQPHDQATMTGNLVGAQFCESLEANTDIYTLIATNGGVGETYVYEITSPELRSYAEVDPSTGVVTLTRKFDYEITNSIQNGVLVKSGAESASAGSSIIIVDDNDNAPFFYDLPYTVQDIYEYPWTADVLLTVKSQDVDNGNAGAVDLLFSNDLDMLQFANIKYPDGTITADVVLLEGKRLDFATLPVLATNIIAKDNGDKPASPPCGGTKSLNTTTSFILQVLDGPNMPPIFDRPSYQFTVEENEDFAEEAKVTARDQDYTLEWAMEYSILGTEMDGIFSINLTTGVLSVNQSAIDRDSQTVIDNGGFYRFTVQAVEVVPNENTFSNDIVKFPFNATADVSIQVTDKNDNSPIFYELEDIFSFDKKVEKNVFNTSIDENTANAIALPNLNIFVQDIDDTMNAQFDISLEGSGAKVFSVSPTSAQGEAVVTLRVSNSSALDYEKVQEYTFTIVAKEGSNSATATVTVNLQDTNDNSPVFDESGPISVNVSESALSGTYVTTITATDADTGINKEITYSIEPDTQFVINETNGVVTVNADLNRESISIYYLTVSATDGPGRVSMTTLQVQLSDENDLAPTFQRSEYYGVIKENANEFDTQLLVSATDNDEAGTPNSEIVYSIISGPIMDNFTVEQPIEQGGEAEIKVRNPINFEDLPEDIANCSNSAVEIVLTVMAEDQGNPPLNGTTKVTILIEDVNDHAPTFIESEYNAEVLEKSKQGVVVVEVQATDADSCSPNNNIQYQIGPNSFPLSTSSAFKITTNSTDAGYIGVLEVNDVNLDRDEINEYAVEVLAIDEGSNRLTGTATIFVTITDKNNKNPVFNSTTLEALDVNETATDGEVVRIIIATDSDMNSDLFYNITNYQCFDESNRPQADICSGWFTIDNVDQTGYLKVNNELDRESVEFISLQISVTDLNGETSQEVTGWIEISIIDDNDNYPQFTNLQDEFTVKEEENAGSYIGEVTATDADSGPNGEIVFSVGPDGREWVEINNVTGRLTSKADHIDREEQGDWLNITVIATDNGNPPLDNSTTIYIRIIDINDNTPEFSQSQYNQSISEDSKIGFVVIQVKAYDNDTNESIRYYITNGDEYGHFDINETTGEISVRSALDREFIPSYRLTVEARDNGGSGNSFSETATVDIFLEDVNDEAPEFTAKIYTVSIREDAKVDDLVTDRVQAEDTDSGINGEIFYGIINGNEDGHFRINNLTGEVFLASSLLNEETEFVLNISATDRGEPPFSSNCLLEIAVEDTNNNNPEFLNLPTNETVSVAEHSKAGTVVFKVETRDNDTGPNANINYELTEGFDYFSIDLDGFITTQTELDYESLKSILVQVSIKDEGSPVLENQESLTIHITDVDDSNPEYINNMENLAVDEGNEVPLVVGKVNEASDKDTEENSINYYYIVGGTGRPDFSLNKTTRDLTANIVLDRETKDLYDLVVKASSDPNYVVDDADISFPSSDLSLLLVTIDVIDINDNAPVFSEENYITDIPYDTQAGTGAIVIEVTAIDDDLSENAIISYEITEAVWILGTSSNAEGVFGIETRDGKGQISVQRAINGDQQGHYELTVTASDGVPDHLTFTTVTIGIVQQDETVVLYSRYTPAQFQADYQQQFTDDLEAILGATVIVTKVIDHDETKGFPQAQSDVYFHAKAANGTDLIPKEEIISALNSNTDQTIGFLNDYGIIGNEGVFVPDTPENDYLKAGLIIACAAVVLVIVLFTIAMCCQSKKSKQKISVLKAAEKANTEMQKFNKKTGDGFDLPTTNVNASNPIFSEDQKIDIDMNFWQESSDDISIDDNAVDSQDDSAIGVENNAFESTDDVDDHLEDDLDIDFQSPDHAQLAAALNAANQARGGESNFANLFDVEMGPENTAM